MPWMRLYFDEEEDRLLKAWSQIKGLSNKARAGEIFIRANIPKMRKEVLEHIRSQEEKEQRTREASHQFNKNPNPENIRRLLKAIDKEHSVGEGDE